MRYFESDAPRRSNLVDITAELRHETAKAILIFDGDKTVWLAKSQCEFDTATNILTLPEWLAKEKGLI